MENIILTNVFTPQHIYYYTIGYCDNNVEYLLDLLMINFH